MTAGMGPWEIATERSGEIHRTGHGVVAMQATLEHLRLRGDSEASYRRMEGAEPWVRVNLLVPLARVQGFAQYVCVVDDCGIVTEVPVSELPVESPECPVHEHAMLLAGWRNA